MGLSERKLSLTTGVPRSLEIALCPVTGVTIPECSCRRCAEEMIRHHSPALLDRRFDGGQGRRAA